MAPLQPRAPLPQKRIRVAAAVGMRKDDRQPTELRYIYMRPSPVALPSGSAYFSLGNTKVLASVYGPRPGSGGSSSYDSASISIDFRFASFAKSSPSLSTTAVHVVARERHYERLLRDAVESVVLLSKYPRTNIDVFVLVLQHDGGVLSAAFNCVALALADSGLETKDVMAAATVYAVTTEEAVGVPKTAYLLDCDLEEEERYALSNNCTVLNLGICESRATVCMLDVSGPLCRPPHLQQLLRIGEAACQAIGEEIRECLKTSYTEKKEHQRKQQRKNRLR
eukprot:GHVS01091233.1.p1 GENE.GHVS01091233.1~~GHVS01091233.1.p1  ORF type:complete len:281 (+),score=54.35 GHVS01091233.1:111-953(+)